MRRFWTKKGKEKKIKFTICEGQTWGLTVLIWKKAQPNLSFQNNGIRNKGQHKKCHQNQTTIWSQCSLSKSCGVTDPNNDVILIAVTE